MDQDEGSWPPGRLKRVSLGRNRPQGTGIRSKTQWMTGAPCLLLTTLLLVVGRAADWLVELLRSQQELLARHRQGVQMPTYHSVVPSRTRSSFFREH